MITSASLALNGKQKYVRDIRALTDGTEITGKLKHNLINKFGKRLDNLLEFHNSIYHTNPTLLNLTMYKSSYCGLSIDIIVNTKV